jgi:hypothetical protein
MGLSRQLPILQLRPMHGHRERYCFLLRDQSPVLVRAPAARRLSGSILRRSLPRHSTCILLIHCGITATGPTSSATPPPAPVLPARVLPAPVLPAPPSAADRCHPSLRQVNGYVSLCDPASGTGCTVAVFCLPPRPRHPAEQGGRKLAIGRGLLRCFQKAICRDSVDPHAEFQQAAGCSPSPKALCESPARRQRGPGATPCRCSKPCLSPYVHESEVKGIRRGPFGP